MLPGLDGTGELFASLRKELQDCEVIVISYNNFSNYNTYVEYIFSKLPREDYIIVAESFSGYIAYLLALKKPTGLKGIVFIASFLELPKSHIFIRLLLYTKIYHLKISKLIIKYFLLNRCKDKSTINLVYKVVNQIPKSTISKRLELILSLTKPFKKVNINSIYIQPSSDYLVSKRAVEAFVNLFDNIKFAKVKAGHLLLQSNPKESADIITDFIAILSAKS